MKQSKSFYSLISLEDFKALLGADDRDDSLSRFCLTAATHTIEQYCHRRLLVKRYFEYLAFWGERVIPMSHYPVTDVLAVYQMRKEEEKKRSERLGMSNGELIEPEYYRLVPGIWERLDTPHCIVLAPPVRLLRGEFSLKVVYRAGYFAGEAPPDLASACMELAAWNMNRYRGRRIGMTGNVRGNGRDGEHFEMSMPENVRKLLESYRRKLI